METNTFLIKKKKLQYWHLIYWAITCTDLCVDTLLRSQAKVLILFKNKHVMHMYSIK